MGNPFCNAQNMQGPQKVIESYMKSKVLMVIGSITLCLSVDTW
jgi:hypothetical protein